MRNAGAVDRTVASWGTVPVTTLASSRSRPLIRAAARLEEERVPGAEYRTSFVSPPTMGREAEKRKESAGGVRTAVLRYRTRGAQGSSIENTHPTPGR